MKFVLISAFLLLALIDEIRGSSIPQGGEGDEGLVQEYIQAFQAAYNEALEHPGTFDPHTEIQDRLLEMEQRLRESDILNEVIESLLEQTQATMRSLASTPESSGLQKRTYITNERNRWTKHIVPYELTAEVMSDENAVKEIQKAMSQYEKYTCLRFLPWKDENGTTVNELEELGHNNYLKFIKGGGCWSYVGNMYTWTGQQISCCGGSACVHEIGHAMGMHHENLSPNPDRVWIIRTNYQYVSKGNEWVYSPVSASTYTAHAYDMSSYMHYEPWMFASGGPTFTRLYPELKEHTGIYYLMREINVAYKCQALCSDEPCVNDGYRTLVDGKCGCVCVPGLDPATNCVSPIVQGCGGVIELDSAAPSASFLSPPPMDPTCTWLFKAPIGKTILLKFDQFNVKGTPGNCHDNVELRILSPGQRGQQYCGSSMEQSFQSINNTLHMTLSTSPESDSIIEGKVFLIDDDDLCYRRQDRGTTYVGKVDFTRFYEPCLPWAEVTHCPHHPAQLGDKGHMLLEENYCRNPDYSTGNVPWCYTNANYCERNYCDPCLLGTPYDKRDDCEQLKTGGFCTDPALVDEARGSCAKTCFDDLSQPESPSKVQGVNCGTPDPVPDGSPLEETSKIFSVGDILRYKCVDYDVTKERTCLSNGQWSPLGSACDLCPDNWKYDLESHTCLKYEGTSVPLSKAVDVCTAAGGKLMTAKTAEENALMKSLISRTAWLPLSDEVTEGTWLWEDGDTVANYSNWAKDQPDNWGSGEDCGTMRSDGFWNDIPCTGYNYGYVCRLPAYELKLCADVSDKCQKLLAANPSLCNEFPEFALRSCARSCGVCEPNATPQCRLPVTDNGGHNESLSSIPRGETVLYTCDEGYVLGSGDELRICLETGKLSGQTIKCQLGCPEGWEYSSGNQMCYFLSGQRLNYGDAKALCSAKNDSYLIMPKTQTEHDFIKDMVVPLDLDPWIGLTDVVTEGQWMWEDGTPLTAPTQWQSSQPDNWRDEEDNVCMRYGTGWNDLSAGYSRDVICQMALVAEATDSTTTVSPDETTERSYDTTTEQQQETTPGGCY